MLITQRRGRQRQHALAGGKQVEGDRAGMVETVAGIRSVPQLQIGGVADQKGVQGDIAFMGLVGRGEEHVAVESQHGGKQRAGDQQRSRPGGGRRAETR